MYKRYLKRVIDIIFAVIGLVLLLPVMLIIAILIAVRMGRPVIFAQRRPGKGGEIFLMYKFRTMTNQRDARGNLLPDSMRLTKLGSFLRKTSLDELPELINVIKGDMSLVGPRPQLIRDMAFFTPEIMARQSVMPGLTGLAQVRGRNNISWEQKFALDLEYIKRITFFKDMYILILTVFAVFSGRDVSASGMATAEDYGDYLLRTDQITPAEYRAVMEQINEV